MKSSLEIPFEALRNIRKPTQLEEPKGLGHSQVTAIVSYEKCNERPGGERYPVSFSAELIAPYCVQLADPVLLTPTDAQQIDTVVHSANIVAWAALVARLRAR